MLVGSIQRNHQLAPEPLPQRERPNETLQLREYRSVPSTGQIRRNPVLETHKAQLFETSDLPPSEVVVGEILIRVPPPQIERLTQPLPRQTEMSLLQGLSPLLDQRLEPPHVELTGFEL